MGRPSRSLTPMHPCGSSHGGSGNNPGLRPPSLNRGPVRMQNAHSFDRALAAPGCFRPWASFVVGSPPILNPPPPIFMALLSQLAWSASVFGRLPLHKFSGCGSSSVGWIISAGEPYRPSGLQYSCSLWILGCVCDSNDEVKGQPHPYPHGPSVPLTLSRRLSSTDNPHGDSQR